MKTPLILTTLLLGALAAAPTSQASDLGNPWPGGSTPDVQCMDVYSETYLGNGYWLVRRDSCSAQIYECPEGYSPPAPPCQEASLLEASSATTASCYMVYTRNNVGQYSIVRRTSCSPPEVYHCPYEGAPIEQCDPVIDVLRLATTSSAAPAYEPNCLYYYRETEIGPVTHVQRDSCHSETYVCEDDDGVHEADETLLAFIGGQTTQPDEAKLQDCVRDTLDDYIAWG